MTIEPRRRRLTPLPGVVVLAALLAGCAPWFLGPTDQFYALPAGQPAKPPGTLVRVQVTAGSGYRGVTAYRVVYWTRTRNDAPVMATGMVTVPSAPAPAGGRPVVAFTHGTTGVGAPCAPSRQATPLPAAMVEAGYPIVAPDYIGLGPVGQRHSYLSGVSEARATVDLVRAAKGLPAMRANDDWYVIGGSQGGHAALFTGEEAPAYAPAMHLRGVVAIAPATDLSFHRFLGARAQGGVVMILEGLAQDYPDLDPARYLTAEARSLLPQLDARCGSDLFQAFEGPPLLEGDHDGDARLQEILRENEPGRRSIGVPVLVIQGLDDDLVVPDATRAYVARACARGEHLQYSEYAGVDHGASPEVIGGEIAAWFANLTAGKPTPANCPR